MDDVTIIHFWYFLNIAPLNNKLLIDHFNIICNDLKGFL